MPRIVELAQTDPALSSLLEQQLDEVVVLIETQLASDLPAVNSLCRHVERYRGKMLRPTLVLLCGLATSDDALSGDSLTSSHRVVAAVAELIHMATLVHDDVLDDAVVRRRGKTVNALYGNEMAVMLGDYLISNAFHLCSSVGDPRINLALGSVTNTLCEGELLQLHNRDHLGIDTATYFEIVRRKTASLIGEACRLGAQLSGADKEVGHAMCEAGIALGIAFQIQDDLLDIMGDQLVVGKSLGRDLDKGKLTLPIIHHLSTASAAQRGEALRLVEDRDAVALQERLVQSGAVDYSREQAEAHVQSARDRISALPESAARSLLDMLARQIIERSF